jgi:predicted nucleic acid-binding protein
VTVVDTSVWIANIRNQPIPAVQKLRDLDVTDQILVGDIVLMEVLQGARDEKDAGRLEADLRQFPVVGMVGDVLAVNAARHYRTLRSFGFTIKIAELLIGTFCVENGHQLLHCDADYDALQKYCGLQVLR